MHVEQLMISIAIFSCRGQSSDSPNGQAKLVSPGVPHIRGIERQLASSQGVARSKPDERSAIVRTEVPISSETISGSLIEVRALSVVSVRAVEWLAIETRRRRCRRRLNEGW